MLMFRIDRSKDLRLHKSKFCLRKIQTIESKTLRNNFDTRQQPS